MPRKRKKKLPSWAHGPLYGVVRTATTALPAFGVQPSMRGMREFGGWFGAAPFNRVRLERAVYNISWCFPGWDQAMAREYAIEAYRHLFSLAAEACFVPRRITEEGYPAHVEFGDMKDGLRALLRHEPCILITGHCGSWELLGYTLSVLGFPVHALYRPLDMKPLDRWVHDTRSRAGLELVDKFGAAEILPGLLDRGKTVGFIADQNAGDRGLFVPFFDRLASAYKTIGLLAIRSNTTIVCGHARRRSGMTPPDGHVEGAEWTIEEASHSGELRRSQIFRYKIDVVDVIRPDEWMSQPDPLFYVTARYRRAIEQMVRRSPEQYLWMHRYWKSRPPHERSGKPFPARLREKIEQLPWMTPESVDRIVERSSIDAALLAGA